LGLNLQESAASSNFQMFLTCFLKNIILEIWLSDFERWPGI